MRAAVSFGEGRVESRVKRGVVLSPLSGHLVSGLVCWQPKCSSN